MPPKAKVVEPVVNVQSASYVLVDMPYVYLTSKHQWSEFKRALTDCGAAWLPDWRSTIAYEGSDYKKLSSTMKEINEIFDVTTTIVIGDKEEKAGDLSRRMLEAIGFTNNSNEIKQNAKWCNLNKLTWEPESKLPARQKLWSWILKSLYGTGSTPAAYYYLSQQCETYDISYLYKRLDEVFDTVTISALDDAVFNVTSKEFDSNKQDIFSYIEELKKANQLLNDLNARLPEEGKVVLKDSYLRSRIIRAARTMPIYKNSSG